MRAPHCLHQRSNLIRWWVLLASALGVASVFLFLSSKINYTELLHVGGWIEEFRLIDKNSVRSRDEQLRLVQHPLQLQQDGCADLQHGSENPKIPDFWSDVNVNMLPVFYSEVHPDPLTFNIYLMETSSTDRIPSRAICAIESFCATNPSGTVWFLTTSRSLHQSTWEDLKAVRSIHENFQLAYIQFELLLVATPLMSLYKSKKFWKTSFLTHNLSDILRLAVVYKSGGLYTDLDIIALKTAQSLPNFLVIYNEFLLGNAVFRFEPGHPMLLNVMEYIAANYNGMRWGHNGPNAVTQVAKKFRCVTTESMKNRAAIPACSTIETSVVRSGWLANTTEQNSSIPLTGATLNESQTNGTDVCGWEAFTPSTFYPNLWNQSKGLFTTSRDGNGSKAVGDIFPHSCGVHLSNKITKNQKIQKGSLVHKLALEACPVTIARHPLL